MRPSTIGQRVRAVTRRIADRWTPEEVVSFTTDEFERDPEACLKASSMGASCTSKTTCT
jgi:hypothetical protein